MESFSLKLAITLLHFLWQGGAILLFAIGANWLFRPADARLRYSGHVIALLLMAACIPVTFCLIDVSWASRVTSPQAGLSRNGNGWLDGNGELELSDRDRFLGAQGASGATRLGRDLTSSADEWNLLLSIDERPTDSDSELAGGLVESSLNWWSIQDWSAAPFDWSSEFRDLRWRVYAQLTLIAPYLALAYFLGSLMMMGRLAVGLRGGDQLRKRSRMLGDESWLAAPRPSQTNRSESNSGHRCL